MAEPFDVAVVGSGASGGWVAQQLTEAGLRVAVLEAGRKLDPEKDYLDHKQPYELPLRGQLPRSAQEEQPIQKVACDAFTSHLFVKDTECPYTTPPDKPFQWFRGRQVGGKSITWGRQTYRLSDYDFKAASRDGFGVDWPLDLRGARPLLRPRGALHRRVRPGRGPSATPRRPVPASDEIDLWRKDDSRGGQGEVREDPDHRPLRDPHGPAGRAGEVPLLRTLRPGMPDRLVLLEPGQHPARGGRHRSAHPDSERRGEPRRRRRSGPMPERGLSRSPDARGAGGVGENRDPLRLHPRVHAHLVELAVFAAPQRAGQRQRRPGALPHGPSDGRGRLWRATRPRGRPGRTRQPPQWLLRRALPQSGRTPPRFHPRVRLSGRRRRAQVGARVRTRRVREGLQEPSPHRSQVAGQLLGLRRMPAPVREPCAPRRREARCLGHPGAPHQHDLRRQREADVPGHERAGGDDAGGVGREERACHRRDLDSGRGYSRGGHGPDGERPQDLVRPPRPRSSTVGNRPTRSRTCS